MKTKESIRFAGTTAIIVSTLFAGITGLAQTGSLLQKNEKSSILQQKEEGAGVAGTGLTTRFATGEVIGYRYRGSFVYEVVRQADDSITERLSSVGWNDGRTVLDYSQNSSAPDIRDEWHIADHLGNVRAVVLMDWSGGTILEQNDYLPFGTRVANNALESSANRYRLGGKEEQRFGGLDLAMSDFGARFYDTFTARWTTRDPLAGIYHSLSPYNYCGGNPVNLVDPDGKDIWRMNNEGFIVRVEKSVEKFELQNQDSSQSITLRDDSMMEALSKGDNISSFVTDKTSLNIDEFLNVFVFASNSSSVEWSVHINEEEIAIGTHHSTDSGGTWSDFGLSSKPETSIHSHPGISQQYEVSSIGFELDGNGGARIWYPSDAYNMRHNADAFARHTFVYFPNSQNVYQYNGRGYKNMGNHLCRYQKK